MTKEEAELVIELITPMLDHYLRTELLKPWPRADSYHVFVGDLSGVGVVITHAYPTQCGE